MDFLKDVLGEELFGQVAKVVKEHNEKPENKEKMKGKRHICKHTGMSLSASNLFIICKKYQLG